MKSLSPLQQTAPGQRGLIGRAHGRVSVLPRPQCLSVRRRAGRLSTTSGRKHLQTCCSSDRASTPPADQGYATGTAVLEQSENFKYHLKAALEDRAKYRGGNLPDDLKKQLERLDAIPRDQRKPITAEAVAGKFTEGISTFSTIDADGCTTLGTMTFQQFKPNDLKVRIYENNVVQGIQAPNQYQINSKFEVLDGPFKGLKGIQSALGDFEIDKEHNARQTVHFRATQIAPEATDTEGIQKWKDAMQEHNTSMDDKGVARVDFPQAMSAWRDYLFFDDELHVTKGHRGSYVVVMKEQ